MNSNATFYQYQREAVQTQKQEAEDTLQEALKTLLAARQQQNDKLYFDTLSDVVKLSFAMAGQKSLSRDETLDRILLGIKQRKVEKRRSFYGGNSK